MDLGLPGKYKDPWLIQAVSRLALEKLVTIKHPLPLSSSVTKHLTMDEHNALRYCAGYVLRSLKRKFASNPSLLSWVEQQTDVGVSDTGDSFTQFTKVWVEKVNRGGLILVSDCVYEVFHSMEQVLRQFLIDIPEQQKLEKDKVIQVIQEDNEIQFQWSIVTSDIDAKTAEEVLLEVIKLWVTIRGHSYASAIVEEYKRTNGALKRTKSLRKELKRQSTDTSE